ncbi:MAG: hypothetical protein H7832_10470 [Magnetococcus sp. DMHC-6]
MTYYFTNEILHVIKNALPKDTSLFGDTPELKYTYLPAGHAKALHPDSLLIVGIRGSGKSYWWSALQNEAHRSLIEKSLPNSGITKNSLVSLGFGEKPSPYDYPGKDLLVELLKTFDARLIWRTIILMHLAKQLGTTTPLLDQKKWSDRLAWVRENPEESGQIAYEADNKLAREGNYHLILFDALDRTVDDWKSMWQLVKGLLQVLLEFRFYKRIRPKAFVRPDHLEDPSVIAFPDSSKISIIELNWPRNELYGLLWQYLANAENGKLFVKGCQEGYDINWPTQTSIIQEIPAILRRDEEVQRSVFHAITGPWMGGDRRRGFPYTWLPNHLGDTRRQVSPRSFLAAMRHAAEDDSKANHKYAIHYESIKRGVQEASKIRVREMQEDYPWVESLLEPLAGLSVPCPFKDISDRWKENQTLKNLQTNVKRDNIRLPPSQLGSGAEGVRKDLENLALFERMNDDRVNLPDVYRVGYGIGRRGGVKVVARS